MRSLFNSTEANPVIIQLESLVDSKYLVKLAYEETGNTQEVKLFLGDPRFKYPNWGYDSEPFCFRNSVKWRDTRQIIDVNNVTPVMIEGGRITKTFKQRNSIFKYSRDGKSGAVTGLILLDDNVVEIVGQPWIIEPETQNIFGIALCQRTIESKSYLKTLDQVGKLGYPVYVSIIRPFEIAQGDNTTEPLIFPKM